MKGQFDAIMWTLWLPLIGSLVQALFGKWVIGRLGTASGRRVMGFLAVLPVFAAFGVGVWATAKLASIEPDARVATVTLFDWIRIQGLRVPMEFRVDTLSLTMVLIVTGVGALIHLYATGYMGEERDYPRFFTYMNLFIVLMLVLVLAGNLAVMFIGWEGVGLCSYLLIGFWYRDLSNARAANKAFIVNRIGDWGMTLGMFLLVVLTVGNWDKLSLQSDRLLSFDTIFANMHSIFGGHPVMTTAIALLLFVGACGKSAQFPLYFWLPDAMAGPTPVSALIHAATMVTAGVFMVNRMHVVFEYSPVASAVMAAIGAFTAFFAALIAFGQTDIKRVLAYSTVSQLGFMFVACGAGVYWAGIFHVTTHAFFKALLFLGAGAVIYAMAHEQDMRSYGRLWKYLPITAATMFVAYLAISGVPGLSGYYSKEAILGGALAGEHATIGTVELGVYSGWLALFVAMLTAWYMTRLTWLTFFGKTERWRSLPAPEEQDHSEAHETHGHEEHGPDEHGFFYSAEEMAAREAEEGHEEHHGLDGSHAPREAPPSMTIPLIILAACSVGAGFYLEQGDKFKTWLYPSDLPVLEHVREHPNVLFRFLGFAVNLPALSIFAAACGIFCGVLIYSRGLPRREGWNLAGWGRFRRAARRQFGYDDALMSAAVDGGREVGQAIWLNFDAGIIDGAVNGIARLFGLLGSGLRRAQTGLVRSYALLMLIGGVALIGWMAYALWRFGGGQ